MKATTKTKALKALDGMAEIVRAEMVVSGAYIEDDVSNPRRAGAICGGRKACAIGSLYLGYGVKPKITTWPGEKWVTVELPGVGESERPAFMRNRPGLRVAYDALNREAERYMDKHQLRNFRTRVFSAPIEGLFEDHFSNGGFLTRRDLLTIIAAAKRAIFEEPLT